MEMGQKLFVAFAGTNIIARGPLAEVVARMKRRLDAGEDERIALFDDDTSAPVDIDLRGSEADVLARLAEHPVVGEHQVAPSGRKGPGRPKLGVVSREVSLLPRHWSWLGDQRGGASATLRRLVDHERKKSSSQEQARKAIDAAHRFMWDIAGDLPSFEEASRALFAADFGTFHELVAGWPTDVRAQLERFTQRASTSCS